ncbi:hypothetical protein [Endozoicomonas sp. YOMI1]|uniref:hypothetical protein n=1 Tax=Endozoicomonas sp. YOMI1 TaxID=2828739 RepID=UPI0021476C1C|nr:hypothetical protein [Endozoicomonas sp. YOMI1]
MESKADLPVWPARFECRLYGEIATSFAENPERETPERETLVSGLSLYTIIVVYGDKKHICTIKDAYS